MSQNDKLMGYFPDNEPIWVISQHLSQKDDVEQGLNRKTFYIRDLNDLVKAVESAPKHNGQTYASLILFKDIPELILNELEEFLKVFNIQGTIRVYEIGREKLIKNSFEFGTLIELIATAKGVTRTQYVNELDPEDKQKNVLMSLEVDVQIEKDKVKTKEQKVDELQELLDEAINKIKDYETHLNYTVKQQQRDSKKLLELTNYELQTSEAELEAERKKSYEYSEINKTLNEQAMEDKYTIDALNNKISKLERTLEVLNDEMERRDKELAEYQLRTRNLYRTSVDGEKYVLLESELEQEKRKYKALEEDLRLANTRYRETQIDMEVLKDQISSMRKGMITQEILGRTTILDRRRLTNTDLIYIKVIDNLPYHRLAIQYLFEELQSRYQNRAKMMIIKQDDGLDNYLFNGLPLYKSLEEVEYEVDQFRLHPHTAMFTGMERLEYTVDCILVVDYIMNNDYLLQTEARGSIFTMVRKPEMLRDVRLELKGLPLTMGPESIFNLEYDALIGNSMIRENRREVLRNKVAIWASKLNITQVGEY